MTADEVHTVYGSFPADAFSAAQAQVDLPSLMLAIMALDEAARPTGADSELRDALARLYGMCATMFCGAAITVSPLEESLGEVLQKVRAGLVDLDGKVEQCSRAIEPLEQLLGQNRECAQ